MPLEEAQAVLAAAATDTPPNPEQLRAAREAFVSAAKTAKTQGDRQALSVMLDAIRLADTAITEADERLASEAAELDALVQDIPELADPPAATEEPEAPKVLGLAEAAARLGLLTPSPAKEPEPEARHSFTLSGEVKPNGVTWGDLGAAFDTAARTTMRTGRTNVFSMKSDFANTLPGKTEGNTEMLNSLIMQASNPAIVAAGGCCSLAEPLRDTGLLATISRPIADRIPTIGATTGAVTFFDPVCLPQDGVGVWTCQQDADVDPADPDTWKQCSHVECADTQTVVVEAIYRCLTIGNFQQRFGGSRWADVLHQATAAHARLAEQTFFAKVWEDASQYAAVTTTGSTMLNFVTTVRRAVASARSRFRHLDVGFTVIAPDWVPVAADLDLLARATARGSSVEADTIEVLLAADGISIIWSPDISVLPDSDTGALPAFPSSFNIVIFPDGGLFRLDGGELNLGTDIRDHDLNRQNTVAAFAETFEAPVIRSCAVLGATVPVSICTDAAC